MITFSMIKKMKKKKQVNKINKTKISDDTIVFIEVLETKNWIKGYEKFEKKRLLYSRRYLFV